MILYRLELPHTRLLALAIVLALSQGCVLTDDFGESEGQQTTPDAGQDAADKSDASDAAPDADEDAISPDASDTGDATESDAGSPYHPITPSPKSCDSPPTLYEVDQEAFGTANGAFFGSDHPTAYDIGQASTDAFSQVWLGHSLAIATTTADNELAVGWASIDLDDLSETAGGGQTIQASPMKFTGGQTVPLASAATADPVIVHDVELFPTRDGPMPLTTDRFQLYTFLILTNAGSYSCSVVGAIEDRAIVNPNVDCSHRGVFDLFLRGENLFPARDMQWLKVRDSTGDKIVGVVTGGTDGTKQALIYYEASNGWIQALNALQVDNAIKWSSDSPSFFTGALLAWGWPEHANTYPLVRMLDRRNEPRAVELAYTPGDEASAGYFENTMAPELPLPPTVDLVEGQFAFTYRLSGSAVENTTAFSAGFAGVDTRGRGVILGVDEPIGGTSWLTYETSDISKLWAFPNGGSPLLALMRGGGHIELASWNLGDELHTVPRAVTNTSHGLSQIDDVAVHSTWYDSATSFDQGGYRGLLGLTAWNSASDARGLYLLGLDNVRDAHSICQ